MNKKIDDLNKTIDWHEQYFRRKFILVHGKESENEDTDVIVKEILNEFLQEKFANVDIDRSHQIGTIKNIKQSRSIIIKFARYNVRNRVFKNKKKLRDTAISITESLTRKRMQMLTKARNEFLFKNVLTQEGKILVSDDNAIKVYYD